MSKIQNYGNIQNLRFRKWVSSKQKIAGVTGHLIVLFDLYDSKGRHSRQIGESTNVDYDKNFSLAFDQAFINAVYKHFSQVGQPILDSKDANVNDLIHQSRVVKWTIRYYDESTTDFSPVSIKVVNRNGKRFTEVRRNGKFESRTPYKKISKKEINKLIEERSGNLVKDKGDVARLDKNYFSKPRKNKKYL